MTGSGASGGSTDKWWPSVDTYDFRARFLPAVLLVTPVIAVVLASPVGLHGAQRLWSVVGIAVVPFVGNVMRKLGRDVQTHLWTCWGGAPTTQRFRWASNDAGLTGALHAEIRTVLGNSVTLPTAAEEALDPAAADRVYADVTRRVLGLTRRGPEFRLLRVENAKYGYARNLLGARRLGLAVSVASLAVAGGLIWRGVHDGQALAALHVLPVAVAVIAVVLWGRYINPAFVRPAADAFAARVVDALQTLARTKPGHQGGQFLHDADA